ncbi:MAG: carboxypeptidase-like regulatory domain-containing protein [Gemmatimonadaceae bacterium]
MRLPALVRSRLLGAVLLVAVAAPSRALLAQQVSGTVRDSASQLPLPGTVVLVLDPAGRPAARSTTDQQGRFRLSPWGGKPGAKSAGRSTAKLRLRILRMGFRPVELPVGGMATGSGVDIALVSFPVQLEEVLVVVPPSCPKRPDRAAALAVLQQVRTALFATVVARSHNSATMTRLLYTRAFDGDGGRVVDQSVRTRVTSATSEPFTAERSAAVFDRTGFRDDGTGSHIYRGPDAETLVDDAFTEAYCFRLLAPERVRPMQVGLRFEPAQRADTGHIDIVGTLWVDTLSRVLKDLTFRYVGLDAQTGALAPEGRLSFRELSNGVVLIDQWSIRLTGKLVAARGPIVSRPDDYLATGSPRSVAREIGGEISRASWPDGYSWKAPLGALRLRVVDGQGRPAGTSDVRLVETDYKASADASGMFVVTDLLPGPYTAAVRDPRLASLDIASMRSFRFSAMRDSTTEARVEVETADDFVGKRCGTDTRGAGKAWLLARVMGADGRPVKDARWAIRDEFGSALVEDGRVDPDGLFHWCQVPRNKRISIDVWRDDRRANASRIVIEPLTTLRFVLQ